MGREDSRTRKNMLKRLDYWIEDVKESLPGDFIQTGGKAILHKHQAIIYCQSRLIC